MERYLETCLLAGILGLVLLEFRDGSFRRGWRGDGRRFRRNLGFLIAGLVVAVVLKRINVLVQGRTAASWMDWGRWRAAEVPACFLAAELIGWLLHYVKHRNGFLWQFHFQHHRESRYDIWLTTHTHGLEVVASGAILAVILRLLGFSFPAIEIYLVFYSFMKVFQHSAHPYSLGVFDRILITPAYHRRHHEVESRCNYGITLTLYDVLFGTARWPCRRAFERAAPLGVRSDELLPFGFWKEMGYFLTGPKRAPHREGPGRGSWLGSPRRDPVSPRPFPRA